VRKEDLHDLHANDYFGSKENDLGGLDTTSGRLKECFESFRGKTVKELSLWKAQGRWMQLKCEGSSILQRLTPGV
jgi:hypothetical protein